MYVPLSLRGINPKSSKTCPIIPQNASAPYKVPANKGIKINCKQVICAMYVSSTNQHVIQSFFSFVKIDLFRESRPIL